MALKKAGGFNWWWWLSSDLTAESVQGASLPLEGIDNIHGGDGLPLGVLGVGDSIPDDVLKEHLQDTPGLLVDEARDTLDTTAARQTPDGRLGDALDVVPEHLPVTLGATLAESLASLSASSHLEVLVQTNGVGGQGLSLYSCPSPLSLDIPSGPIGRGETTTQFYRSREC